MFDTSNLEELLQYAKDPQYSEFVRKHIFPVKYNNYHFWIHPEEEQNHHGEHEDSYNGYLNLYGIDFYMDVLENFGKSIRKLYYHSARLMSDENSAKIYRQLNEYCADSLEDLYMGSIKENVLTQFKKPFSKLTELHIAMNVKQIGPVRSIGEIFPKLRELALFINGGEVDSDNRYIGGEFPYLEKFNYNVFANNRSEMLNAHQQIGNILKKSPRIRSLGYKPHVKDIINIINEYLPNLEHLFLEYNYSEDVPIQFDHVKFLTVTTQPNVRFGNLTFPRLDTLYLFFAGKRDSGNWLHFFKNHQSLPNLNCTVYSDYGLREFFAELPNLETIRMQFRLNVGADVISQLMDDHEHLSTFEYQIYHSENSESTLSMFLEKFGSEWNIGHAIEERWFTITLNKKN